MTPEAEPGPGPAAWADRQGVLDALARFCERVDEYDIDGMAQVFAEHAVADYGPGRGGPVVGREAIRRRIEAGQAEFRRTHHQLGQSSIQINGRKATGLTYVTAWHERWNGSVETACLRYRDEFERSPDGTWLIVSRRVDAAVVDGFPGTAWTWVDRRQPEARR